MDQANNGIDLLFHTNAHSGKTAALDSDPSINIAFLASDGAWISIAGEATVSRDKDLIKEHYTPALRAWMGDLGDGTHDGGAEDPRLSIIRVHTKLATYAVSNRWRIGQAAEYAKGIVTGETPTFMRIKEISEKEAEEVRKGQHQ